METAHERLEDDRCLACTPEPPLHAKRSLRARLLDIATQMTQAAYESPATSPLALRMLARQIRDVTRDLADDEA